MSSIDIKPIVITIIEKGQGSGSFQYCMSPEVPGILLLFIGNIKGDRVVVKFRVFFCP